MTRAATKPATIQEVTFEEYMAMPVTKQRQEVIDGVIETMPGTTFHHQLILMTIYRQLFAFVSPGRLGSILVAPCDLLIREVPKLRMRQPDLMYYSTARVDPNDVMKMKYGEIAPDLAVEIRSESERQAGWAEKQADYASIGVAEVWRVHPEEQTVEVLALDAGQYVPGGLYRMGEVVRSPILPGFELPVATIFG